MKHIAPALWVMIALSSASALPTEALAAMAQPTDAVAANTAKAVAATVPPANAADATANAVAANAVVERPDLDRLFAKHGLTGTFVADLPDGEVRVNPKRAGTLFRPASTFKIVNAVTAFESGVAPSAGLFLKWNGVMNADYPEWNHDQTLEQAFRASCVWYFVELGRRNGRDRLLDTMRKLDYGNANPTGSDKFWIDGELRISAEGQTRALGRLARGEAGFAPRSLELLRKVMLLGQGAGVNGEWRLYGKTGMAVRGGGPGDAPVGWFVGWVERDGVVIPFALNASPAKSEETPPALFTERVSIAKDMLSALGVITEPAKDASRNGPAK